MKTVTLVARYLLGLAFVVFGLNGFLHFMPMGKPPTGSPVDHFMQATVPTGYMSFVFAVQLVCGLALLAGVYVPLAMVVLAPVIVNILLFHATMDPKGLPGGLVAAALWAVVAVRYWPAFAPLFRPRLVTPTGAVAA